MLSTKNKITKSQEQVAEYLHYCEFIKHRARTTVKTYRKDLVNFIARTGTKDFRRVTNQQLNDWQAGLLMAGSAGKTVNNYRDSVMGLFKYLVKQGSHLAIDLDRVERANEEQRNPVYFTGEEVAVIKGACEGLRELVMISLLYDTGMRISELRNLKVEHVSGLTVKIIQGKGRKDRVVLMQEPTKELLVRWLNLTGTIVSYIFPSPRKFSDPLSEQQIRESINAPIRRAGFAKGSAHSLRHSFITSIIDNGMDIFTAQTLAGHSDPKVTRRYYHTSVQKLTERYSLYGPKHLPITPACA